MKSTVGDAMTVLVHTCRRGETLDRAAKLMWEHDCSEVPVIDDDGLLVAMVSDRSACTSAYTQGKALSQIPVIAAALERVKGVRAEDSLESAHEVMRKHHLRCLPVVDKAGRLIGVLSITDVIRATHIQGEPRFSSKSIQAR
jgi:CBS domain-containing protein